MFFIEKHILNISPRSEFWQHTRRCINFKKFALPKSTTGYHIMRSFQQKRGWRNILESWPVLVFLAILLGFFAWGVVGFMGKMQVTRENRRIAEYKISELNKEKEKLSSDIAKLKTESGVEESIREKFGLAKEGEGLIVVVEDKTPPAAEDSSKAGFFSSLFFWKNWFK